MNKFVVKNIISEGISKLSKLKKLHNKSSNIQHIMGAIFLIFGFLIIVVIPFSKYISAVVIRKKESKINLYDNIFSILSKKFNKEIFDRIKSSG